MNISSVVYWINVVDTLSTPTVHCVLRLFTTFLISFISVGSMTKFTADLSFKGE